MLEVLGLKNFKAFSELELPLGALTLLSGLNGSGKSSVLQALGVLRQSFDHQSIARGELDLNGDLVSIGTGGDVLHHGFVDSQIDVWLRSSATNERDIQSKGESEQLRWTATVATSSDVLTCTQHPNADLLLNHNLFSPGFQFLRADRITPFVTFPKSQNEIGKVRSLGSRGQYTAHFLQAFGDQTQVAESMRESGSDAGTSVSAQVNAWMQLFSPGVRVEPIDIPMTDLVRLAYAYRGPKAAYGEPLRATNVGFGLTHVLPILVACLSSRPGNLLMIENPEAQLHPRGQVAMGRLLAAAADHGAQIIVETHSDHVLNGIRIAVKQQQLDANHVKFHFFSRGSNFASEFETPILGSDGRLSYWPAGFFDQWENSLDQLLA